MSVTAQGNGFPIFRLELHLPCLVLEPDEPSSSAQGKKVWSNLDFLLNQTGSRADLGGYAIFETHSSVVVSGSHRFDWFGYAFGILGPGDAVADEYEEENDAYDPAAAETADDRYHHDVEDFFATGGGCLNFSFAVQPTMDPRIYFLQAVQHRLDVLVRSHEYLVRKLEAAFHIWVSSS